MANPYHLVVARKSSNVAVVYCGPSEVEAMAAAIKVTTDKASEVDVFLHPAPSKIVQPKPAPQAKPAAKKASPKKASKAAAEEPTVAPPVDILDGK